MNEEKLQKNIWEVWPEEVRHLAVPYSFSPTDIRLTQLIFTKGDEVRHVGGVVYKEGAIVAEDKNQRVIASWDSSNMGEKGHNRWEAVYNEAGDLVVKRLFNNSTVGQLDGDVSVIWTFRYEDMRQGALSPKRRRTTTQYVMNDGRVDIIDNDYSVADIIRGGKHAWSEDQFKQKSHNLS